MEIRHLEYFLAVVDTGTVTLAARRCFVAQSALSAQVSRLESEVGSPLFLRSRTGMQLTAAGHTLVPMARRILAEVSRTGQTMAALRGLLIGRLRVGVIQAPPAELDLIETLARFHRQHPAVDIEMRTGASEDHIRDVAEGALDIAIVATREVAVPPAVSLEPLVDDPLVVVMASDADWNSTEPFDLSRVLDRPPFIHYRDRSGLRRAVRGVFDRAGVAVDLHVELDQISDMVRLAALGVGVTMVPTGALTEADRSGGRVRVITIDDPRAHHPVGVVMPVAPSPAAAAFRSLLGPIPTPAGT